MKAIRNLAVGYTFEMTKEEYLEFEDQYIGFCVSCGEERDSCEPDAANYLCENCERRQVFGTPQLLLMGLVTIVEGAESGS